MNKHEWGERRGTTPFRSPLQAMSAFEDIIGIDHIMTEDEVREVNRRYCQCGVDWHDKEKTCKPQTKRELTAMGPRWGETGGQETPEPEGPPTSLFDT